MSEQFTKTLIALVEIAKENGLLNVEMFCAETGQKLASSKPKQDESEFYRERGISLMPQLYHAWDRECSSELWPWLMERLECDIECAREHWKRIKRISRNGKPMVKTTGASRRYWVGVDHEQ